MRKEQGLTLIELLVVISILLIIIGITIQSFRSFQGEEVLSDSTEKIINILRLAQSKTLASEGASQYGVYFDKTTDPHPHQYILFKLFNSINYSDPLRNTSSDEIHQMPKSVEINEISLGGGQEVVFSRLTGETTNYGTVSLMLKSDNSKTRTVSIKTSGKITLGAESAPTDAGRIKDTRHLNFKYSPPRLITNEILTLTFYGSSTVTQSIPISSNIVAGQLYWEGKVNVNSQDQKIKIHTILLDNSYTIFSVHRDGRYNDLTIPLKISISGESDYLVEYSDDCLAINQESLNVSNVQCQ